jgi:hypothetical protein
MNFNLLMYAFLKEWKFDLLSYNIKISRINKERKSNFHLEIANIIFFSNNLDNRNFISNLSKK